MNTIPDFRILDTIDESNTSLLVRALRNRDNHPVILKILKTEKATTRRQNQYKQEFELLRSLHIDGGIHAISLEQKNNTQIIVLEDVGAHPLQKLRTSREFMPDAHNLKSFLMIAIQMAEKISDLHAAQIIHKSINPHNFFFNPNTDQLQIFDFSQATYLPSKNPILPALTEIEGNLSYISPEQSGRMNRSLDYRSDYYSLGVTFYEMLTGKLPFTATDPLELIHCHLANIPQPPTQLEPAIPIVLSDIILKLMAKAAENRYQSASGLTYDLQQCLLQLDKTGTIKPFKIGQHDYSANLTIPEKLYGREKEVNTLQNVFNQVSSGNKELMLVTGYPGIGKTSLVQELHKPITQQQGLFITGKFDQFQKDVPYSALVNALNQLIQSLLTESSDVLREWQKKLSDALRKNGQVIVDVVPQLEKIIGPQPAVPQLNAKESHMRFNLVFQDFIRTFCQPSHPLVIFLDNLQWADSTIFTLLESLMIAPDITNLLLLGCYRDNEVNQLHPLINMLNALKEEECVVHQINLNTLTPNHIRQLLADTLHTLPTQNKELANLITKKTEGNPFFIKEFLETLYREKLLRFMPVEQEEKSNGWQWDMAEIKKRDITSNVAVLIASKLNTLPAATRTLLQLASCIGTEFDITLLALIYQKSKITTYNDLLPAIREDFCSPLSELEAIDDDAFSTQVIYIKFKFSHDYLQQVSYDSMDLEVKKQAHLSIGNELLQAMRSKGSKRQIFELVNHLNLGRDLISNQTDLNELADLNLQAGLRAKDAAAYTTAFNYFQAGIRLLGDDCWQSEYGLSLNLYVEAATIANLKGDFGEMTRLNNVVLLQSDSILDQIPVFRNQIQAYKVQGEYFDAIDTGLFALNQLGVIFPRHPSKLEVAQAWQEIEIAFKEKTIGSLVDSPLMTNPEKLASVDIISRVITAAWMRNPSLCTLLILKRISLLAEHGNTKASGAAFAAYGVHLRGIKDDIETSFQFGELALNVLDRFETREFRARTKYMVGLFIKHWKHHTRESLSLFDEAYQSGLETGDVEFATFAAIDYATLALLTGKNLETLYEETAVFVNTFQKIKRHIAITHINIILQTILNYQGKTDNPIQLIGNAFNEQKEMPNYLQTNSRGPLSLIHVTKLILCYQFGLYEEANKQAILAKEYVNKARSAHFYIPILHMYEALALLATFAESTLLEQERILQTVSTIQKKMTRWANYAPINHLHRFYLIEAERHRVSGDHKQAESFFQKAITAAEKNDCINEIALTSELAGKFHVDLGETKQAKPYLQKAKNAYYQWGALAKVSHIDTQYETLLKSPSDLETPINVKTDLLPSYSLDIDSMLKGSQTLTSETDLSTLLINIMQLVIKTAGAQRGLIILESEGIWKIEAEAKIDEENIQVLQSLPLPHIQDAHSSPHLPVTIINYVIHSSERVILHNAAQEGLFLKDTYIADQNCKSILCMPLIFQTKLDGILYLENNLTTDAFTPDRVDVLTVLATQAAISIANARLVAELTESKNKYRYLFNNGNDAVYVYRLAESGMRKIVDINEVACKRYGYSKEEFLTMRIVDISPTDKLSIPPDILIAKIFAEKQVVFEAEHITKDGRKIPVEINSNLIEFEGETAVIAIARDITNRKQNQAALNQYQYHLEQLVEERTAELMVAKEAAEAASHAKSAFLASMSHELRTPLNAILGYAQVLKQRPFDPETLGNLNTIQKSGEHLLTLINDSLDVAKIEAGKMELFPAWLQFPSFLESLADIIRARTKTKNLQFNFQRPDTLPTGIKADETRLRQILLNLLGNAVKFTEEGAVTLRVSLSEGDEKTAVSPPQTTFIFEVKDTGVGISLEQQPNIFKPYEQAGSASSRSRGTGLGLTISYRLVQLMGGELKVHSTPGKGSTFWFELTLPVTELAEETAPPPQATITGYAGPQRTILVVDDIASNRLVLKAMMKPLGLNIVEAGNGRHALEVVKTIQPDLILMDRWMPEMDGLTTTKKLRKINNFDNIPIIAASASISVEDRISFEQAGANDFLPKPIALPNLVKMLQKHLYLDWLYKEKTPSPSEIDTKSIIPPPTEELEKLYKLSQLGSIPQIQQWAARIEANHQTYVPFTYKVRLLADNFDIKEIQDLVNQYLKKT